jgi:threonylcarbamoyladenosine tRNA methylthiotransferase MtaB
MGRPYDAAGYARVAEAVVRARPGAALGADVMVGFPGEREEDHRATLSLLASLPVSYLHVFAFSPRPGTRAASAGGRPAPGEVARRAADLRELSERLRARFLGALRDRPLEVVVERVEGQRARGTSREFAPVRFGAPGVPRGRVVRLRAGEGDVRAGRGVAPGAAPS